MAELAAVGASAASSAVCPKAWRLLAEPNMRSFAAAAAAMELAQMPASIAAASAAAMMTASGAGWKREADAGLSPAVGSALVEAGLGRSASLALASSRSATAR